MAFAAPLIPMAVSFLGSSAGIGALGLASAGIGAASAISGGNYASAVARNNAAIAERNAARISEASQREAQRSDEDYRALLGEQLAAQGASGFDILGRSQRQARMLTRRTGRKAAVDITQEGTANARNSLQEAADFRSQGKQAKTQGYLSAAGQIVGAAGDFMKNGSMLGRRPRGTRPSWYGRG